MSDTVKSKILEPFSFWPKHASAVRGFGGAEPSPDPFYCFHTPYHSYQGGPVYFKVRFIGARASIGEMALRVHAFRPDKNMDAVMIAGASAPLSDLKNEDLEMTVRIVSIPGVTYALFGRFSDPSDLAVTGIEVWAEEISDGESDYYVTDDLNISSYSNDSFDEAKRIQSNHIPSILSPVSQPCTENQIKDDVLNDILPLNSKIKSRSIYHWKMAFAFQALKCYGMVQHGTSGALIGEEAEILAKYLAIGGCLIVPYLHQQPDGQFDFLVSIGTLNLQPNNRDMQKSVLSTLKHVLRGGIAIFIFDYITAGALPGDAKDFDRFIPSENQIRQLALHIVGHGSAVAQLNFPDEGIDSVAHDAGRTTFGLIVRR